MIERRGSVWRVRIYRHGRYVSGRSFRRKGDAVAWESAQTRALAAGTWVAAAVPEQPLAAWIEQWWAARAVVKPSTTTRYRGLIDRHIVPEFGRRPLNSVSRHEVQAWATELAARRSASTARQALGLVRQAYAEAVADGVVARNPARGVRLPRVVSNPPRPLTHDQLWRLVAALGPRDRALVLVMGYGGLRWGEAAALRCRDVSEDGCRLRVHEAVSDVSGVLHVGTVKDHEARTVRLPATAAEVVSSWAANRAKQTRSNSNPLFFPSAAETYLRNQNWRRNVLTPTLEALELPPITPHNLRDTAATLAINAGASVVAVARMLGHETPSTTLRHYAGFFPDDFDGLAARLDGEARNASAQAIATHSG